MRRPETEPLRDILYNRLEFTVPSQAFRHTSMASLIRLGLYRISVGSERYPFVFRAPEIGENLSSYKSQDLYVHVPFCQSICPHCPYYKVLFSEPLYEQYREALTREMNHYLSRDDIPAVTSLYFGGGTPSMTPELIDTAIKITRPKFTDGTEIGVEVHPRDANWERLQQLKDSGVNMISLGIETFQEDILKKTGRTYNEEQAQQSIENAMRVGFNCVDANLIYGIPGQKVEDSVQDVQRCIDLGVDHLSAYPLITFEHTPLGKAVQSGKFQEYSGRDRARAQKEIANLCLANGFKRTSVWSFTKGNKRPYTTVTRDEYIGFGAGAGSKVDGTFWFNTFSVSEYNKLIVPTPALVLETTDNFKRLHWLYWQIYKTRIDPEKYEEKFDRSLIKDFGHIIFGMRIAGLLQKEGNKWVLTERGAILVHRAQMLFSLTYIDKVWTQCQREPWPKQITLY